MRRQGRRRAWGYNASGATAASRTTRRSPPPADTPALRPNPMLVTPEAKAKTPNSFANLFTLRVLLRKNRRGKIVLESGREVLELFI